MAERVRPLQALASLIAERRLSKEGKLTPLTESQRDPQLSKLAAAQAVQRKPQGWDIDYSDPNQLTLADAPNGMQFLEEHRNATSAMRNAAADNFTFIDNHKTGKTINEQGQLVSRGNQVVSSAQMRDALVASELPVEAMEALGTTVSLTNKIDAPARYTRSLVSNNPIKRRGMLEVDSENRHGLLNDADHRQFAITHELGHTTESLTRGGPAGNDDREERYDYNAVLRGEHTPRRGPSASAEGFADGIARRFSGQDIHGSPAGESDPRHTNFEGYHYEDWAKPENQAAFVAHKTHAWSTGQLATGSLPERMYRMASNSDVRDALTAVDRDRLQDHIRYSPHRSPSQAAALSDVGYDNPIYGPDQRLSGYVSLVDTARNLSEQFMDSRRTGRQLSLLGEQDEYDTYDVDKVDWDS
jgi:hypothetical protein